MKKLKLFPKIFLYTFLVMLLVTLASHLFLYMFAPQMQINASRFLENGVMMETTLNTEWIIQDAIFKALPISLACSVVVSLVCSLIFSRAMAVPIKQISITTEQMEQLDKTARCPVNSSDEIGVLACNVNSLYVSLLSTIENLEEEKKKVGEAEQSKIDFLRAASHELKTPVTALHAILENMLLGIGKYKDRDTYLVQCKEIAEQLSSMIQEVLETSRLDFTQDVQISEPFDLSDTLPTLCEPYKLIAKANQIDFSVEIHEGCPLDLPKRNLEKILANLLSNAVSYTKPGSKVSVVLYADRIMIENECTPIPQETLSHLFEPFYRPDFARNRQDGGNGLGLYIVSTLSKAMGLSYTFEPMASPQGMRFLLFFTK